MENRPELYHPFSNTHTLYRKAMRSTPAVHEVRLWGECSKGRSSDLSSCTMPEFKTIFLSGKYGKEN